MKKAPVDASRAVRVTIYAWRAYMGAVGALAGALGCRTQASNYGIRQTAYKGREGRSGPGVVPRHVCGNVAPTGHIKAIRAF